MKFPHNEALGIPFSIGVCVTPREALRSPGFLVYSRSISLRLSPTTELDARFIPTHPLLEFLSRALPHPTMLRCCCVSVNKAVYIHTGLYLTFPLYPPDLRSAILSPIHRTQLAL